MDEEGLKQRLPAQIADRVRAVKLVGARANIVLDASGLTASERCDLEAGARAALEMEPGVEEVNVAAMADRPARRLIAIGSGKGGVGKSTLTANLAIALSRSGHRVGVVDADIYGPSQPRLLASEGDRPEAADKTLIPVETGLGVKLLSMGHLVEPGRAIAWRGPMVGTALGQLIDADWGDTDLILVDLPPGTGDVQLTMLQRYKPAGAVIVSTPQDLALIDARRAGQLLEAAGVPILGLVENMAGYACPHCGEISDPFGRGGVEAAAETVGIPFLGRIPLTIGIREASDAGEPPAAGDGPDAAAFLQIAERIAAWLAEEGG